MALTWSGLEAFGAWMIYPRDLARNTRRTYLDLLEVAERRGLDLGTVDEEGAIDYLRERRRVQEPGGLNVLVSALNLLFEYRGLGRPLTSVKVGRREPDAFTDDELSLVRAYRHPWPSLSRIQRAMVHFALYTGFRVSEMHAAHIDDVRPETNEVYVREPAKAGWKRVIRVDSSLFHPRRPFMAYWRWRLLEASADQDKGALWIIDHGPGPSRRPALTTLGGWAQMIRKDTGVDFRWHRLRHTLGRQLVLADAPSPLISYIMGHTDPAATARYTQMWPSDQDTLWAAMGGIGDLYGGGSKS